METDSKCPTIEEWERVVAEISHGKAESEYEHHLQNCKACREILRNHASLSRQQLDSLIIKFDRSPVRSTLFPLPEGITPAGKAVTGGTCVIVKAWDESNKRNVAVKMPRNWIGNSDIDVQNAMKEASAIGRLDHPNIVKLYGIYPDFITPVIVMEWVEGISLADRLNQCEPNIDEVYQLMIELTSALKHAHKQGILHRDIKPSNILLEGSGFSHVKLCDFGNAKTNKSSGEWSTASGFIGTPYYMAPESFRTEAGITGPSIDIYSMGVLLYRLITGRLPFQSDNPIDLGMMILNGKAIPPRQIRTGIPKSLEKICLRCLEREPMDRYQSIADLESDFLRSMQGKSLFIKGNGKAKRVLRWIRREPKAVAVVFSMIFILTTVILMLASLLRTSRYHEQKAKINMELAEAYSQESKKRLSESIKAMSLASPIFKRILSDYQLDPGETKRISDFAKLREVLSLEPDDLKERLNHHYLTLELADALSRIKGEEADSIKLTRIARDKIGIMIQNESEELSRIQYASIPSENFVITLLEKTLLRYGHACSQLFNQLPRNIAIGNGNARCIEDPEQLLIKEAIKSALNALETNPDLDEAKSDLANYYFTIAMQQINLGNRQDAIEYANRSIDYLDQMIKLYPSDMNHWHRYVLNRSKLAQFYLENPVSQSNFTEVLKPLDDILYMGTQTSKINQVKLKSLVLTHTYWRYQPYANRGEYSKSLSILDNLLSIGESINSISQSTTSLSLIIVKLRLDRMCILKLMGLDDNAIETEYQKIQKTILPLKETDESFLTQAYLFIFHPLKIHRDLSKAKISLDRIQTKSPEVFLLQRIVEILSNTHKLTPSQVNTIEFSNQRSLGELREFATLIFETEILIQSRPMDSIKDRLDSIKSWRRNDNIIPVFLLLRWLDFNHS
jgi:serine/threonine protein kinase/tetratricopeptide (TPR) repeat protein